MNLIIKNIISLKKVLYTSINASVCSKYSFWLTQREQLHIAQFISVHSCMGFPICETQIITSCYYSDINHFSCHLLLKAINSCVLEGLLEEAQSWKRRLLLWHVHNIYANGVSVHSFSIMSWNGFVCVKYALSVSWYP